MLTFGSLFAGIGGFDLGFERAGMQCVWQVEIDDYCRKVLAKHWPEVPRHDDIKTFDCSRFQTPDIICGGFPCQDISYAGKGAGLAGERSGLFYEAMRVVREVGPRFVVLENVAALLTRGLGEVLGTLASLGYDAEWHCIPAAAVGAPHIRDRVFILAYAAGDGGAKRKKCSRRARADLCCVGAPKKTVADANSKGLPKRQGQDSGGAREDSGTEFTRSSALPHASGDPWRKCYRNHQADGGIWSFEPDVGRVANGVPKRVDRLRGLGNAVVPQVAEWIGRRIVEAHKD